MTGPFRADTETLHQAAKDVRTARNDVNGDLARLRGVVDDLAVAWAGQASTGFQSLMVRWDADVAKLLRAMDEIADLLDQGGVTHQVNDENQQQMINRFNSALNPS
jgi:early secretory antigenic target protein ESAT-6